MVNRPTGRLTKKASKGDVGWFDYLHVDIDCADEAHKRRMLAMLMDENFRPKGVPLPTVIIDSGGGYNAFWKLREPVQVNGRVADIVPLEAYNRQLEILFGADHCHNVDRIMRVPGTINRPDAVKRARGRVDVESSLVFFDTDNLYALAQFVSSRTQVAQSTDDIAPSSSLVQLDDLDDLNQWKVPDRVKIIIAQGSDPDNPKQGDNSRSAWLFDVLCQLVRCDVPTEVIWSLCMDSRWDISASVLDKKSPEIYLRRQLRKAMDAVIDPELAELNDRFFVAEIGGKMNVCSHEMDQSINRRILVRRSFNSFREKMIHRNKQIKVDENGVPVFVPLAKWWLGHEKTRRYDSVVFLPGADVTTGVYNLWSGFAYNAVPGDQHLPYLQHLKENICQGNEDHYTYLIKWMARAVQRPNEVGDVAVVLRGGKGTGKSSVGAHFGALFGHHSVMIFEARHLTGNFNAHLLDAVVVVAEEAFFAGDKRHESVLKGLITEPYRIHESKGVDAVTVRNCVHLIMTSNSDWVVPASDKERRFFVLDVSDAQQQNTAYFKRISDGMKNGGYESLLYELSTLDIKGWDHRAVPATKALQTQQILSLDPIESWWLDCLQEGSFFPGDPWPDFIARKTIHGLFEQYFRTSNSRAPMSPQRIHATLKRVCPALQETRKASVFMELKGDKWRESHDRQGRGFVLPTLTECREAWERLYGPQAWAE